MEFRKRGFILIISSPSGCGKTTIVKSLIKNDSNSLHCSISATTRLPRFGEVDKQDYIFIDTEEFARLISTNYFLEYAQVFGNHYGTPKEEVESKINSGCDVIFDIDWQGTIQLQESFPNDVISIFILPPSISELRDRLKRRGLDNEEEIEYRMDKAKDEIKHYNHYDYVFINKNLNQSISKVESIIKAERNKRIRRGGLSDFVNTLLGEENFSI